MFKLRILTTALVLTLILVAGTALAGAKLQISDDAYIDLGYRLQAYWQNTDVNLDDDTDGYESFQEFKLRRARFRLKGVINSKVSVFMQTDVSGKNMQMIDAFITYKPGSPWFQFVMGRNMAPSSRQALTSSGALMALDRPLQVGNALNWGAGGAAPSNGNGPIPSTPDRVRDNGLTLFGSSAVGENSLKYYLGLYNGVQSGSEDKYHMAARAQFNLWDAEAGYYNSSTYLGKKKTLGIGLSYDAQEEVGSVAGAAPGDPDILADYSMMAFDLFLELPNSKGNALTAEFGYNAPDYDGVDDMKMYSGSGYYGQVGYYLASGFQPWFLYESFGSDMDALTDDGNNPSEIVGKTPGDYTSYRFGVTYYIAGQHANIKLAYESRKSDVPVAVGNTYEDTKNTITLGFFTTY